jgi:hypothetical protein
MAVPQEKYEMTAKPPSNTAERQDRLLQIILTAAALGVVLVIEWLRDPFAFF